MIGSESLPEFSPSHSVSSGLHSKMIGPPSIGCPLNFLRNEKSCVMIITLDESKILFNCLQPIIGFKRILLLREYGWMGVEEIRVVVMALKCITVTWCGVLDQQIEKSSMLSSIIHHPRQDIHEGGWWWWSTILGIGTLRDVITDTGLCRLSE